MVRNIPGTLLAFALMTLVSCSSRPKEMNKKAQLYYNAGTQSLLEKNYTDALTNLLKANEIEKNNPEILNNLGMAYYFKNDTDLAIKYLKRTIELDPKNADAKNNIGSIYFEMNRIQEAETIYRQVLKDLTYDKQARTYYNLGVLELEKKNNPVEAEKFLLLSLKESEDYCPSHYKLGTIYFARRQFKRAHSSFREATMGTCLNSPAAHYQQALTLIELKKFTDARLKLDEIQHRFAKSTYAVKARSKEMEVDELEKQYRTLEAKSSPRKVIDSPEY